MLRLRAAHALLPDGWAANVEIQISDGLITAVNKWGQTPIDLIPESRSTRGLSQLESDPIYFPGFMVPGMGNVHSHAFQRAMAGMTEARTRPGDSFWTWREMMYRFAARITPGQMQDIAAWLYVEMLKAGFTAVAEFHYLHRAPGGSAYDDPGEMSHRLIAAAAEAGIAITHLPVLYVYSGFGAKPPNDGQARFILSAEEYLRLLETLRKRHRDTADVRIGAAFHSLRAVDPRLIDTTLQTLASVDPSAPIHIHIAEQAQEVADCIAWSGQRPVAWLLDHAAVDERWCLVHATHVDDSERERLAASGAVAGLCPTTEANLGDGVFPAREYLEGGRPGRFAIGSDSHVSVSVAEELRLLEYGQRLTGGQRAVLAAESQPSPGERIFTAAAEGGAQALGIDAGRIAPGARADLVVLDPEHPAMWNKTPQQVLDAWIFAGDSGCVRDVMVGGTWRVRERRHERDAALAARFRKAQAELAG